MAVYALNKIWRTVPQIVRVKALENALYPTLRARALSSTAQYLGFDFLAGLAPGTKRVQRKRDWRLLKEFDLMSRSLLTKDAQLFIQELLPIAALWTTPPYFTVSEFFDFLFDGLSVYRRRRHGKWDLQSEETSFPDYYRRSFHFQTDGYFSKSSAARYDRQVDLLFGGTADAMRRLWVEPLLKISRWVDIKKEKGRYLKVLEIGCGAGSATPSLLGVFPECEYYGLDLSPAYLEYANERFSDDFLLALGRESLKSLHWIPGNVESVPQFLSEMDIVLSVFMFHELPLQARKNALAEAYRALKPGGIFIFVDSAQLGDSSVVDEVLPTFPQNYHEPFFKNYIKHPLEELTQAAGFSVIDSGVGFVSKFVIAQKSET